MKITIDTDFINTLEQMSKQYNYGLPKVIPTDIKKLPEEIREYICDYNQEYAAMYPIDEKKLKMSLPCIAFTVINTFVSLTGK